MRRGDPSARDNPARECRNLRLSALVEGRLDEAPAR